MKIIFGVVLWFCLYFLILVSFLGEFPNASLFGLRLIGFSSGIVAAAVARKLVQ